VRATQSAGSSVFPGKLRGPYLEKDGLGSDVARFGIAIWITFTPCGTISRRTATWGPNSRRQDPGSNA